jgi:hypothetical protein
MFTLYTAVGQPFTAKMAVVNLDTPFFKGHATVELVANLAADALFINFSPYEGFTKYVAAFVFLSLILRFGAQQFFAIWPDAITIITLSTM